MTNFQEPRDKLSIATAALAWLPPALTTMLSLLSLLRIFSYPKPLRQLFGLIKELFSPLVTPEDLFTPEEIRTRRIPPSQWRSVILTSAAALLCIGWFTIAGYVAATRPLAALHPTAMAVAWLSPATSLAIRPSTRPDYSVLALSILQIVFHGQRIWTSARSLRDIFQSATLGTHLLAVLLCLILIGTILSKPILDIPTSDNMAHLTEKEVSEDYTNPEDRVNLAQWISFTWISSMLAKGSRMDLTVQDVWQLSPLNWAQSLHNKFKEKSQHSIGLRLLRLNWADIIADGGLQIIVTIIDFAPAFFTKKILEALALPPPLRYAAFKWAVLALVLDLVGAQLGTLHSFHASRALLRMRTQLLSALHEKTLLRRDMSGVVTQQKSRMDDNDLDYSSASTGRIVNLLSSDTSNVINSLTYLLMLLEVPIQLVIALFFLYTLLGWASFAGLAVLAVTIPLNNWITRQNKSIMKELFKARDERINQVNTFVRAIRFIRSNDWQDRWQEKILASREKELRLLTNRRFSSLGLGLIWQLSPPAIIVLSFAAFTLLMKQPLTVPIAFVAISLFGNLSGPLTWLPQLILQILLAKTSAKRLESFLNEGEIPNYASVLKHNAGPDSDPVLVSIHGVFAWESRQAEHSDVSLPQDASQQPNDSPKTDEERRGNTGFELNLPGPIIFPVGLTIICGATASGKSSFLQALLGEMPCVEGKGPHLIKDMANVAYGAQSAWIETGTVKENILFGSKFDQARYDAVLEATCLKPDIALFDGGDQVEVGERGITLSGGQKARIALAKCLYSHAKVILLDDPLSAVDSHTAAWLRRHCFQSPLMQERVVILVTHHLDLVGPLASQVITLDQGMISNFEVQEPSEPEPESLEESKTLTPLDARTSSSKLVQDEEMAQGSVSWSVYRRYMRSMGYRFWAALFILMGISRLVSFGQNWVVKTWGEAAEKAPMTFVHYGMDVRMTYFYEALVQQSQAAKNIDGPMRYLLIYVGVATVLLNVALDVCTTAAVFIGTLMASRTLFKELLHSVSHTKMRWFDSTPAGRILNRFSEDFAKVDGSLSMSFRALLSCIVRIIANLIIVSLLLPWFLVAAVGLVLIIYLISRPYVKTSRSLRRLDAVYKSPIYSGFSEVVHGVSTIRAFACEKRYQDRMYDRLDTAQKINYAYFSTNRWLNLRFDVVGGCVRFITYSLVIFTGISQGLAAIAIVSCGGLISVWQSLIRMSAQLELDLNAIERIDHYIANEQEPPSIVDGHRPPMSWPSDQGGIDIENLNVRYAEGLPLVLTDLTFSIKAGEKVGLVGRTGSGKSTLGLALLRFIEAESGSITIDGIDISQIGLSDLRRNLTVMSQDAVLFSGTIRDNLDPFDEYDSNELWDVLYRVGLAKSASSPPTAQPSRTASLANVAQYWSSHQNIPSSQGSSATGVSSTAKASIQNLGDLVAEGGHNFSAGERQLLALARALLRRPKILLMDEASSSIDKMADAKLQSLIRDAFSSSTVITIAHRLLTVCEYDRILVLDAGRIVEYDSPKALLQKGEGAFYDLCARSTERDEIFAVVK